MTSLLSLPKAELHVHLDGAMTPSMVRHLAKKNKMVLPDSIFSNDGESFFWRDFSDFHRLLEASFSVVKDQDDYYYITYEYLKSLALQNTLYAELIVSPFHANLNQVDYQEMLQGLVKGIDQARLDFGIEARILMVFLRHYGPREAAKVADQILGQLHPYVVGVNLVGDIKQYEVAEFEAVFDRVREVGLGVTCHAGELEGGPIEIWQAIDYLGATRISHGVRCVEDKRLMNELIKRNVVLEICPTSNIVLKMYPNYESHPFKEIYESGIKVTLNTDDPGCFGTSLTKEYEIAKKYYELGDDELRVCTLTAIKAGFIDQHAQMDLLKKT